MEISVKTDAKEEFIDITDKVQSLVSSSGVKQGICIIQSLHTTAGITINENADPDVKSDILKALKIFDKFDYDHAEGNSPAHVKTSLIGPSTTIIINNNKLQLGTWQGIIFGEFDGPRNRKVSVKIIKG
ncbi:YjbQ family protein [Candidatus Woesearchaeota archaeon]|nr:YjbQ family protein [Candidatus Woesearchaeota archaeon]